MSESVTHKRTLGVTFTADQKAAIVVWAPFAKQVDLLINNRSICLHLIREGSGYWHLTTDQLKPGDQYVFVLDDEKEWTDPTSLLQNQGVYGPSQAFDTNYFYWEDLSWVNPPVDEYIVYEIDIHTFTAEGTLKAIVSKLGHLRKLGVNAILIRPVTPFPNSPELRTETAFLFAVQASYGGPGQLQSLVNACHYEGLAVILDLSYKQVNRSGYVFREGSRYTARKQSVDRQEAVSDTEESRQAYRHYFTENALMWFRDFHVDALRLQDVYTLPDADQLLRTIREHTNALTLQTGRQYYLLIEQDLTVVPDKAKQSDIQHGDVNQLNSPGGNCNAYYMDFNHNRHKTKQYRQDCLCDSTFSAILQQLFDRETETISGDTFFTVLQTYHKTDTLPTDEQPDQQLNHEFLKLIAGSIMVSPCVPTLFMGEEWGVINPFREWTHNEPIETGSGHATLSLPGHQTYPSSVLPWEMLDEQPNQTLYRYYQSLTALRRQQPALYHLNPKQAHVTYQNSEPTLLLQRTYKSDHILCLMNFSSVKQTVTLPKINKNWQKLLDSADPIWDGPGASPDLLPDASRFVLQPESIVVYKAKS